MDHVLIEIESRGLSSWMVIKSICKSEAGIYEVICIERSQVGLSQEEHGGFSDGCSELITSQNVTLESAHIFEL
jgi:hypothetical protein